MRGTSQFKSWNHWRIGFGYLATQKKKRGTYRCVYTIYIYMYTLSKCMLFPPPKTWLLTSSHSDKQQVKLPKGHVVLLREFYVCVSPLKVKTTNKQIQVFRTHGNQKENAKSEQFGLFQGVLLFYVSPANSYYFIRFTSGSYVIFVYFASHNSKSCFEPTSSALYFSWVQTIYIYIYIHI